MQHQSFNGFNGGHVPITKYAKKAMAKAMRQGRNERKHDEMYPSAEVKAAQAAQLQREMARTGGGR